MFFLIIHNKKSHSFCRINNLTKHFIYTTQTTHHQTVGHLFALYSYVDDPAQDQV